VESAHIGVWLRVYIDILVIKCSICVSRISLFDRDQNYYNKVVNQFGFDCFIIYLLCAASDQITGEYRAPSNSDWRSDAVKIPGPRRESATTKGWLFRRENTALRRLRRLSVVSGVLELPRGTAKAQ
jgi:hypothetical protein